MKNTFVKLFLALAMCFMIGSALVACGGVSLSVSEDGYFVIDGEKTDIKAPAEGAADCKHDLQKFEVKAHTADADGVVLEVCALCDGYAKVSAGTVHNFVEDVVAATCTEEGFEGEVCTICGAHGEGEAIDAAGHKWSDDIILTNNVNACTDGGVAVQHCSVCKEVSEPTAIDPVGHVVANWSITTYPNGGVGEAEGKCIYCAETKTYELPALNDEDYTTSWKDGKVPTCYIEGVKVYTYVVKNEQNDDKVWDKNIDCVAEAAPAVADHILGGVSVNTWYDATINAFKFYADTNEDGKVEAVGFQEYANGTINCEATAAGYFVCEACDFVVQVDEIYKAHFGAETVVTAALCHTPGTLKVDCVNCETAVSKTYYADHKYEYTLVDNEDGDDATWDLVGKCMVEKTIPAAVEGDPATKVACWAQETVAEERLKGYTVKEDITASKIGTVKPTCYAAGYETYKYTETVGAITLNVEVKVAIDKDEDGVADLLPHTLNGKTLDKYVDELGASTLNTSIKGIMPTNGEKFDKCGNLYDVVFECSVCAAYKAASQTNIGTLVNLEDIVMPHNELVYVVEGENGTKAATCSSNGKEFFKCLNEGCELATGEHYREIPALTHNYTLTYAVDVKTGELTVKGNCSRDCKDADSKFERVFSIVEEFDEDDFTITTKTEKTCSTPEVKKFVGNVAVFVTCEEIESGDYDEENVAHVKLEDKYYNVTVDIAGATKDEDGKFVEKYVVGITFDVTTSDYDSHKFCEEDAYEVVVYNRDWDKDGVVDAIETYTFKYCVNCFKYEQVKVEVKQLTDVFEAPAEDAE